MRVIVVTLLVLIMGVCPAALARQDRGPARLGLSLTLVESLLDQTEAEIDLNQSLFRLTGAVAVDLLQEDVDLQELNQEFDNMATILEEDLPGARSSVALVKIISDFLYKQQGFRVDRSKLFEGDLNSLLLHKVLAGKQGHCLSLSLVYLCLAERLNLPISGVMVPNHFFVRYHPQGVSINIETTAAGEHISDRIYKYEYLRNFDDQVSLKNLTKKETIAIYLSNIANQYKLYGQHQKAMEIFKRVLTSVPERASLYVNLGNTYERDKKIIKAILCYQKAIRLNPYLCEAHYNLGLAHYLYTRHYDDARRHGAVAQKLGCRLHPQFQSFLERSQP